ncbi:MAG: ribosome hibernation-promoting factor, HPF/YfiA family [Bacteroidales bacterium]
MNIKINAVRFTADQKLTELIEKKVTKLNQYFDNIIGAEITLKVDKPESHNNKIVELSLSVPSHDHLFVKKQEESFEKGIDQAVDAMRKQIDKYKERMK